MDDESVGTTGPHPYRLVLDLGCCDRRLPLLYCSRDLSAIFGQAKRICWLHLARRGGAHPRACAQTLVNRAAVSLGHGSFHVHTAVDRLSAEGWRPVSMGDLSLDRGRRLDRFHSLPHHPCIVLFGFLGNLA